MKPSLQTPNFQPSRALEGAARVREWCVQWDYRRLVAAGECASSVPVIERFDWDGKALEPGFRRVRVMGRQLYVLSRAACGGIADAAPLAKIVANSLMEHAVGPDGQFVSRLTPDGSVLDGSIDLYDVAFGLFGLAWWHRYSGDLQSADMAERAVLHLRANMRSPSGTGFIHRRPGIAQHQQNPHMHLFEAAIFLAAFTGRQTFRDLADELFELALACLFDRATGSLAEQFDADWRPIADAQGRIRIEPGHQFEWAWLLDRYASLSGRTEALPVAQALFDFGLAYGCDPVTGLIVDAVCSSGSLLEANLRIWPNTELLKAQIALAERKPERGCGDIDATIARVLRHFLGNDVAVGKAPLPKGYWIDYLHADATTPKSDHIPASTMYHIMFAFSEVLRYCGGHDPLGADVWLGGEMASEPTVYRIRAAGAQQ